MQNQSDQVYGFVDRRLHQLLGMSGEGQQRALLANLRRGIGKKPGDIPEIWGVLFQDFPEELLGKDTKTSRAEWACYTALTLFALHQQGKDPRTDSMTEQDTSLGKAMNRLAKPGDEDDLARVARRFNAIATAADMEELSHYLRGAVQLLRTNDIPLDYPALAKKLFLYQFPEYASDVRLSWGRDFYHTIKKDVQPQNSADAEGKDE